MRFYLSVRHGNRIVRDDTGSDLPDLEAAREEAIVTARVMMAQAILAGEDISSSRWFEIADETGRMLATVPFTEAVQVV